MGEQKCSLNLSFLICKACISEEEKLQIYFISLDYIEIVSQKFRKGCLSLLVKKFSNVNH